MDEATGLEGQLVAGRYKVLGKLGEGGMGIVYLAEHVDIEKKVALKVLLHEFAGKADLRDRFIQEAKAAARIGHENIVDITDFGSTPDGSVFFAMEFLEGLDLSRLIRQSGPVPWSRAKPILLQICRALGAAHAKGIIHRDMKPENIYLIEREGRSDFVKLLDFGIAKMSMEENEKSRTRTGMIFGTPEYMSPEQAQGNKPDHRVDIYAVGVIMYELLTGRVPFKADTFMGILTKHIFENPLPPTQVNPEAGIPVEVEEVVLKAMSKDRDERFQSMTEMAAAIAQASGRMTRPTSDAPIVAPRRIGAPSQILPSAAAASSVNDVRKEATLVPELSRRGGPRMLLWIVGALALVGGFVAVIVVLRAPSSTAQPKQPSVTAAHDAASPRAAVRRDSGPARRENVMISLRSNPAGAEVYLGAFTPGKAPLGRTPGEFALRQSKSQEQLTLHLRGYYDLLMTLVPDHDQNLGEQTLQPVATDLAARVPAKSRKPRVKGIPRTKDQQPSMKKSTESGLRDLKDPFSD